MYTFVVAESEFSNNAVPCIASMIRMELWISGEVIHQIYFLDDLTQYRDDCLSMQTMVRSLSETQAHFMKQLWGAQA